MELYNDNQHIGYSYSDWIVDKTRSYVTNVEANAFLDGVNCVLNKFEHWATVAGGFIGLPVGANSDSLDLFPGWLIKDDIIKNKIPYFRTRIDSFECADKK